MLNLSLLTPIVVASIAVIGTLTPFIIDKLLLYNQNKPIIEFDASAIDNLILLNVTNNGGGPATNISLLITSSPYTISNLTNIMSMVDL